MRAVRAVRRFRDTNMAKKSANEKPDFNIDAESTGEILVAMMRDEPQFPGGPLVAEVHPDEVQNWLAAEWREE